MPLYEYVCENLECDEHIELFRSVAKRDDEIACQKCQANLLRVVTAHGGYTIKGDNTASRRPSQAGSFRKGGK